jgi:hypothetical protein
MNAHELIEKVTEVKSLIAQETQDYDDSLYYIYARKSELMDAILSLAYSADNFVTLVLNRTKQIMEYADKNLSKSKYETYDEAARLIKFLTVIAVNTQALEEWNDEIVAIFNAAKEVEGGE